jgi:predicted esterase
MRVSVCLLLMAACVLGAMMFLPAATAKEAPPPSGKALKALAQEYLGGDFATRTRLRARLDQELGTLSASQSRKLARDLLKIARKMPPRIGKSGRNYLLGKERGKYLVSGKPGKALFVGLHGGGEGSGSAESVPMSGGGWWWVYPEVLEKTARGWTDSGTEEFVVQLIDAAKRTGKVDPDRIYICGHSMGGFGSWHIGAHHADTFAGIGAFAGAPIPIWEDGGTKDDNVVKDIQAGVLPNLFNIRLHVYQSLDDQNVPPGENQKAIELLHELKKEFPDGFDFRYEEVDGRGHGGPPGGYMPDLKWLAEHKRNARPKTFLWQPHLPNKRQFYWVYWDRPELDAILEVRAKEGNVCEITVHQGEEDLTGLSVLVGAPLFDLDQDIVVKVNGEERFKGKTERRLSTLLLTLPRFDEKLLFDARIDL